MRGLYDVHRRQDGIIIVQPRGDTRGVHDGLEKVVINQQKGIRSRRRKGKGEIECRGKCRLDLLHIQSIPHIKSLKQRD